MVEAGVIPVAMGGDHSITLPELRAIANPHWPAALSHFNSQDLYTSLERFRPYASMTPDGP
jgi:agmatinase